MKGNVMQINLPALYPTFGAYMRKFGKNLLYSLPAVGVVLAIDFAINAYVRRNAEMTLTSVK